MNVFRKEVLVGVLKGIIPEFKDETDGEVVKFLQSIFQDRLDDKRFNPYLEITDEIEQEVMEMNDKLVHLNADFEAFEMK